MVLAPPSSLPRLYDVGNPGKELIAKVTEQLARFERYMEDRKERRMREAFGGDGNTVTRQQLDDLLKRCDELPTREEINAMGNRALKQINRNREAIANTHEAFLTGRKVPDFAKLPVSDRDKKHMKDYLDGKQDRPYDVSLEDALPLGLEMFTAADFDKDKFGPGDVGTLSEKDKRFIWLLARTSYEAFDYVDALESCTSAIKILNILLEKCPKMWSYIPEHYSKIVRHYGLSLGDHVMLINVPMRPFCIRKEKKTKDVYATCLEPVQADLNGSILNVAPMVLITRRWGITSVITSTGGGCTRRASSHLRLKFNTGSDAPTENTGGNQRHWSGFDIDTSGIGDPQYLSTPNGKQLMARDRYEDVQRIDRDIESSGMRAPHPSPSFLERLINDESVLVIVRDATLTAAQIDALAYERNNRAAEGRRRDEYYIVPPVGPRATRALRPTSAPRSAGAPRERTTTTSRESTRGRSPTRASTPPMRSSSESSSASDRKPAGAPRERTTTSSRESTRGRSSMSASTPPMRSSSESSSASDRKPAGAPRERTTTTSRESTRGRSPTRASTPPMRSSSESSSASAPRAAHARSTKRRRGSAPPKSASPPTTRLMRANRSSMIPSQRTRRRSASLSAPMTATDRGTRRRARSAPARSVPARRSVTHSCECGQAAGIYNAYMHGNQIHDNPMTGEKCTRRYIFNIETGEDESEPPPEWQDFICNQCAVLRMGIPARDGNEEVPADPNYPCHKGKYGYYHRELAKDGGYHGICRVNPFTGEIDEEAIPSGRVLRRTWVGVPLHESFRDYETMTTDRVFPTR